jgi:hypothetical protein
MTNLIFNGDDPNTVLPNAPSIDSFTTLSYSQVYGNLDGSGVTLNTQGAMLPEGFRDLQVWSDFMSCVEQVMGSPIASYIQSLLGMREPYFASTDPSIDRVTLLKIMNFIGFKYAQNDIFDDDDLRRFVRHTPLFWMEKGNRNFIQYMSFVINAQLSMEYLWTQDYVNFYPEGSSEIGKKITDPSRNLTANQQLFAAGGTSALSFPIAGPNGLPVDTLLTTPILFSSSSWAGVDTLLPTARTNLLRNSTTIGSSGWTNSGVTVGTGTTSLDGTTTATTLTATSTTGYVRSSTSTVTPGQTYTESVYVNTTGMPTAQQFQLRIVDGTTPTTVLGTGNFQLVSTTSGGLTQQQLVSSGTTSGATFAVYPTPVAGWYRVGISVSSATSTSVYCDILPDVIGGTGSIAVDYSMFELGAVFTKYIPTYTSTVTVTDYALSGKVVSIPTALPSTTNLMWSGGYNQLGTWYQTSHVYIVYDVNKFASTVNSGFTSQQAMEQFFYSISPIELVVRGFVLNLTLPPTVLYLAGDVMVKVLQPTNVDAANLYPNSLYPLPQ